MSAVSTSGINPDQPEAPIWIKVIWGGSIGLIAWVMITSTGTDGIRMLSVLAGFPAYLLLLLQVQVLLKWSLLYFKQFENVFFSGHCNSLRALVT